METTTPARPPGDFSADGAAVTCRHRRIATALLVAAAALVWIISLSRNLLDPIGYDQALYTYLAEQVAAGQRLYVDVWEQNTPGVVGIHWLAIRLIGRSPVDLRVFDALWQFLTLAALLTLAGRDGKRWAVGWLAVVLYALAYYGTGYVHTAQREGFAVLPMLLAAHAMTTSRSGGLRNGGPLSALCCLFAGVMGFFIFAIKPPLGLCFGVLWLQAVGDAWHGRRAGAYRLVDLLALTLGFVLSAAVSIALMIRAGWFAELVRVLMREDIPGYIAGPRLIREIAPLVFWGVILIGVVFGAVVLLRRGDDRRPGDRQQLPWEWVAASTVSLAVFVLLLATHRWRGWQPVAIRLAGLWLPAVGTVLIRPWRGRSRIWQTQLLLAAACLAAITLQGQFYLYHCFGLFACAGYLAANELVERVRALGTPDAAARGPAHQSTQTPSRRRVSTWAAVCLGAVVYLTVGHWGRTMTFVSAGPYLLSNRTLAELYTQITKHKTRYPTYETTARTAERVRELTNETDPIACVIIEARLYYFSQRPPVHRLLLPQPIFSPLFPEFMRAIHERQPKVVLARVPLRLRHAEDLAEIQSAVFDDLESHYGPSARVIRQDYRVTEVIDDVCILQPATADPDPRGSAAGSEPKAHPKTLQIDRLEAGPTPVSGPTRFWDGLQK